MKKLLFLHITLLSSISVYSQEYRTILLDKKAPQSDNKVLVYDSLSNIEGTNISEYKKFIGQDIIFLQRNVDNNNLPVAFANFEATQKTITSTDTVWHKRRKKPKPTDYSVTERFTISYAPQYYKSSWVTYCGVDSWGYTSLQKSNNTYSYYAHDSIPGLLNRSSGYYTPYQKIEGKTFRILDITKVESRISSSFHSLRFTLLSEHGDSLYWYAQSPESPPKRKDIYYPVVIKGYIDKCKDLYMGKYIYMNNKRNNSNIYKPKKFLCSEFVFVGEKNIYMTPCFLLKDENDKEVLLPLCTVPVLFSNEFEISNIDRFYPYLSINEVSIEDAQTYEERLLREAAEKEKIRKEREVFLYKKFGKADGKIILEGKVRIGMNQVMVLESWGYPSNGINKTTGSYGTHEQWCYGGGVYLYFTNGKLTTIQD